MSHFAVLVVGGDVEGQLQPFHEFECTGIDDQYIQDIDITEEMEQEYENDTCRAVQIDGKWVSAYDERFRTATSAILSSQDKYDYGGREVQEVPVSLVYTTFEKFLTEWHGLDLHDGKYNFMRDGRVYRRTNPNAKWDWWEVGGRWTGFFKVKPEYQANEQVQTGSPGLMTEKAAEGTADSLTKKMIDLEGMREAARNEAVEVWDKIDVATAGLEPPAKAWAEFLNDYDSIDEAREAYNAHPYVKALKEVFGHPWHDPISQYMVLEGGRQAFIERQVDNVCVVFAVVKDGQWYERGHMGWWGMVSDEKDINEWGKEFNKLLDSVSDDTLLTVVDCHI